MKHTILQRKPLGNPHRSWRQDNYVLSTFSANEEKNLAVALENGTKAALAIIDHGVPEAANRFNGSHP